MKMRAFHLYITNIVKMKGVGGNVHMYNTPVQSTELLHL